MFRRPVGDQPKSAWIYQSLVWAWWRPFGVHGNLPELADQKKAKPGGRAVIGCQWKWPPTGVQVLLHNTFQRRLDGIETCEGLKGARASSESHGLP